MASTSTANTSLQCGLKLSKQERDLMTSCAEQLVRELEDLVATLRQTKLEDYGVLELAMLNQGLLKQIHTESDPSRGMRLEKLSGKLDKWLGSADIEEEPEEAATEDPAEIVPVHLLPRYQEITKLTDKYCREFLEDYSAELCRKLAAMLCTPGTPAARGKAEGWAAGVVNAMEWVSPHIDRPMVIEELSKWFGVSPATVSNKVRTIREGLNIEPPTRGWYREEVIGQIADQLELLSHDSDDDWDAAPERTDAGFQIKIALDDTKPPVWRRLHVPDVTLEELHEIIQDAMPWDDSHLHEFRWGERHFVQADVEGMDYGRDDTFETDVTLADLVVSGCKSLKYTYDFGDNWEHTITIEQHYQPEASEVLPRCTAGAGACPPDDCGGVWGYYAMLEVLKDPEHEQYDDLHEWLGDDFDPKAFSVEEVNDALG
ncbi:MAG: plasmid pRiA4b ORF-3 family protein [Planctomycetales bacterium]|nr:plasmid pRiA4b ORF-3 family protein [Planctomycetales bacterium]